MNFGDRANKPNSYIQAGLKQEVNLTKVEVDDNGRLKFNFVNEKGDTGLVQLFNMEGKSEKGQDIVISQIDHIVNGIFTKEEKNEKSIMVGDDWENWYAELSNKITAKCPIKAEIKLTVNDRGYLQLPAAFTPFFSTSLNPCSDKFIKGARDKFIVEEEKPDDVFENNNTDTVIDPF